MLFSISVVHSPCFSSLRRMANSLHYESFENFNYAIIPGHSSNHLSHETFDVSGVFKLRP